MKTTLIQIRKVWLAGKQEFLVLVTPDHRERVHAELLPQASGFYYADSKEPVADSVEKLKTKMVQSIDQQIKNLTEDREAILKAKAPPT